MGNLPNLNNQGSKDCLEMAYNLIRIAITLLTQILLSVLPLQVWCLYNLKKVQL